MPRSNKDKGSEPVTPGDPVNEPIQASAKKAKPRRDGTEKERKKKAAAAAGAEHPANLSSSKGTYTLITDLSATVPVVIAPGARSPVDDILEVLHHEVIGQERAIQAIGRALLRSQEGFRTPGRPISVMFFAGPTGVGKTETVRALARALHKDWRAILKIDCSEYSEPHAVARLLGAPPGYIGSDLPAVFSRENVEGVKNRLILFDEIEKAHPRLHNILLQIMDEGRVTLAKRTKDDDGIVSFEDCIIILTSNVGAHDIDNILHANRIGFRNEPTIDFVKTDQQIYMAAKEAMKKMFAPEFRNRITEFIVFRALERPSLYKILQKLLNISAERFASLGFKLMLSDEARDWLVDHGLDQELGVRPLVRAVERHIDTKVAELHAYGLIQPGDILEARVMPVVGENGEPETDTNGRPRNEMAFYRIPRENELKDHKRHRGKKRLKTEMSVRY
ncbi:ATP-dependent Clp protease ATP-binding subunit [bacterium]|nr:ATP-dependent Clp protease ATP-binding subunit [bacterium]